MKRFENKEDGITMIELLVALTISSIVILTIYGVFITGVKAYQKIGIEGFLRDEADYVVSIMINEINQSSVDYIQACDPPLTNCVEFIDSKQISVNNNAKELVNEEEKAVERKVRFIFNDTIVREVIEEKTIIERYTISSENAIFTNSNVEVLGIEKVYQFDTGSMPKYKSAIINMNLQVGHSKHLVDSPLYVEPLQLESRFGF